jgi:hypothetical protein
MGYRRHIHIVYRNSWCTTAPRGAVWGSWGPLNKCITYWRFVKIHFENALNKGNEITATNALQRHSHRPIFHHCFFYCHGTLEMRGGHPRNPPSFASISSHIAKIVLHSLSPHSSQYFRWMQRGQRIKSGNSSTLG